MITENNIDPLNNIDPSQASIFEDTTYLEIDHSDNNKNATGIEKTEKTGSNKFKILAALAIVAMAGYISYWVQSPIQLKTDVLGSNTVSQVNVKKNVTITLYGFEPANLNITKGTSVKWTNTSSEDQTLIGAAPNGDGFTSPVLSTGQTFSFTFDKNATFKYYSTYNPSLKATITVGTGTINSADQNTKTTLATPSTTPSTTSTTPSTPSTTPSTPSTTPSTPSTTPTTPSTSTTPVAVTPSSSPSIINITKVASNTVTTPIVTSPAKNGTIADNTSANQNTEVTQNVNLHGTAYNGKLAKTGPEDGLYIFIFGIILYFNRKKLFTAFQR